MQSFAGPYVAEGLAFVALLFPITRTQTRSESLNSCDAYDIGGNEAEFLTGIEYCTVKKIEVFQIADQTALLADLDECANGRLFQEMAGDAG
jgi:hypothetical protein